MKSWKQIIKPTPVIIYGPALVMHLGRVYIIDKYKLSMVSHRKPVRRDAVIIGWPTLLELRLVLTGKGFPNAAAIVDQLAELPNVTAVAFDQAHYHAAERAFERFGKGRHPVSLNMGDCFSYAVAAVNKAPLLFKGQNFGKPISNFTLSHRRHNHEGGYLHRVARRNTRYDCRPADEPGDHRFNGRSSSAIAK